MMIKQHNHGMVGGSFISNISLDIAALSLITIKQISRAEVLYSQQLDFSIEQCAFTRPQLQCGQCMGSRVQCA